MTEPQHYAACTDPDRLSVSELIRYARVGTPEAERRLRLDAAARLRETQTAELTSCGCRGRSATPAEAQALVAHVAPQQYAEPVDPWAPSPPTTAANATPGSFAARWRRQFEAARPGERAFLR